MRRTYFALTMELVLIIDIYIFIYSNFFGSLYEYGEIKYIFELISENIISIIVFVLVSTVLIVLKVKPSKKKEIIERNVLIFSMTVWIAMIIVITVFSLSLNDLDILFAFFVAFTTLTFYLGVKKFGITFL